MTAIDSLAVCLAHDNEQRKVESLLLKQESILKLVEFFRSCGGNSFVQILEPFLKMITCVTYSLLSPVAIHVRVRFHLIYFILTILLLIEGKQLFWVSALMKRYMYLFVELIIHWKLWKVDGFTMRLYCSGL